MALSISKETFDVSLGSDSLLYYRSEDENTTLYVSIVIDGSDQPIIFTFYQGNLNEQNKMSAINDHEDNPISLTLDNGNHFVAIDTFFGLWGDVRFDVNGATVGTIEITSKTNID